MPHMGVGRKAKEADETIRKKTQRDKMKKDQKEIEKQSWKMAWKEEGGVKVAVQSPHQSSSFGEDPGENKHTEECTC